MSRRSHVLPKFTIMSSLTSIVVIVIIVVVAYVAGRITAPKAKSIDTRDSAPMVKTQQVVNKSFNFAVKNDKGVEITKIKYTIENVGLQDQIIIRGTRAQAIKGKTFLIVNFSLMNTSNKYIQLNSRDYLRLLGNTGQFIAPDIHNDPIQIQPISTKESRLGFPVDDMQKNFTLSIGEVDGKKTTIPLAF